MNIRCPHCQTVFRIDPDRVPAAGVRARCSRCAGVFFLTRTGIAAQAAQPQPAAAASAPPKPPAARHAQPGTAAADAPARTREHPSAEPPARSQSVGRAAAGVQAGASAPTAGTGEDTAAGAPRVPSFARQDPQARAARLARALVSDIVAYHPERLERSVAEGTLRSEFREEIVKSWEEYVAQVGLELAKGTPFFRNALNEILARGQKIF